MIVHAFDDILARTITEVWMLDVFSLYAQGFIAIQEYYLSFSSVGDHSSV